MWFIIILVAFIAVGASSCHDDYYDPDEMP